MQSFTFLKSMSEDELMEFFTEATSIIRDRQK